MKKKKRIPTEMGMQFNGANQLLQVGADGKLPIIDGSNLINMPVIHTTGNETISGIKTFSDVAFAKAFIPKGVFASNNETNINYWTKIARLTVEGEYDNICTRLRISTQKVNNTSATIDAGLYWEGGVCYPTFIVSDNIGFSNSNFKGILVSNDEHGLIVDIYMQYPINWGLFNITELYSSLVEGYRTELFANQPVISSLPAGTQYSAVYAPLYGDGSNITGLTPEQIGETIKYVTGSDVTTTSTGLVDITGLTFAAEVNSVYEIEALLKTTTSADTTGCKYGVKFSGAGASFIGFVGGTTAAANTTHNNLNAFNTANATALNTTSNANGYVLIKGFVTTGANAGDLTICHLKMTSGTSTVKIGSLLKVRKVA